MTDRPGVTDHSACTQVGARPLRWSAVVVSRGLRASAVNSTPHTHSTHTKRAAAVCAILGASLLAVGAVLMKPIESSGISARIDGANGSIDPYQELNMKTSNTFRTAGALGALAVTQIALVSGASAQATAVQWKVADGGNGHWYQVATTPRTFFQARDWAVDNGGSLALIDSSQENQFLFQLVLSTTGSWNGTGPFFGLFQDPSNPSFSEPNGGWIWVDETPRSGRFESFCGGQPDNSWGGQSLAVYWAPSGSPQSCWDDDIAWTDLTTFTGTHLIEWSADCNADSIVDYGQCLNGTLPDYNSNHVPDCCERGEVCVAGNYPVQWHVNDGGNGHWYQGVATQTAVSWTSARARAVALGSQLASIGSRAEDDFVARLALENPLVWPNTAGYGPWLGGYQTSRSTDPFANWAWVTGEPWLYISDVVQFDNSSRPDGRTDDYLHYINQSRVWNDVRDDGDTYYNIGIRAYMAEWSADCNSDGIIDFGQCLDGSLPDTNSNNIPDCCEEGIPCSACYGYDLNPTGIVDGADLGALPPSGVR